MKEPIRMIIPPLLNQCTKLGKEFGQILNKAIDALFNESEKKEDI